MINFAIGTYRVVPRFCNFVLNVYSYCLGFARLCCLRAHDIIWELLGKLISRAYLLFMKIISRKISLVISIVAFQYQLSKTHWTYVCISLSPKWKAFRASLKGNDRSVSDVSDGTLTMDRSKDAFGNDISNKLFSWAFANLPYKYCKVFHSKSCSNNPKKNIYDWPWTVLKTLVCCIRACFI